MSVMAGKSGGGGSGPGKDGDPLYPRDAAGAGAESSDDTDEGSSTDDFSLDPPKNKKMRRADSRFLQLLHQATEEEPTPDHGGASGGDLPLVLQGGGETVDLTGASPIGQQREASVSNPPRPDGMALLDELVRQSALNLSPPMSPIGEEARAILDAPPPTVRPRARPSADTASSSDDEDEAQIVDVVSAAASLSSSSREPDHFAGFIGLTPEQLQRIPTQLAGESHVDLNCTICMASFTANEKMKRLPCCHFFHPSCIDAWLRSVPKCPSCKEGVDV